MEGISIASSLNTEFIHVISNSEAKWSNLPFFLRNASLQRKSEFSTEASWKYLILDVFSLCYCSGATGLLLINFLMSFASGSASSLG